MNKPRNPRYFPRMKVRGRKRRMQAPFQRMAGTFDAMGMRLEFAAWQLRVFASAYQGYKQRRLIGVEGGQG